MAEDVGAFRGRIIETSTVGVRPKFSRFQNVERRACGALRASSTPLAASNGEGRRIRDSGRNISPTLTVRVAPIALHRFARRSDHPHGGCRVIAPLALSEAQACGDIT